MSCLFLYNPNSGRGKISKHCNRICRALESRFGTVESVATKSAEDMETRARLGADRYDAIVFSGGDGTFHTVLQGIGDRDVALGYIPSGTVNDVARSLGIPRNWRGALKAITEGRIEGIDCMRVNGTHYAVYIAAAGMFTSVTYRTPQSRKRRLGRAAYAWEALCGGMTEPFHLSGECGGKRFEEDCMLVLILNGRTVAGFPVNRGGSMRDGKLETVLLTRPPRPDAFRRVASCLSLAALFLFGARRRKRTECFRGDRVVIETGDVVWDFDGEEGIRGSITVEVLRRHMKLFVPKK